MFSSITCSRDFFPILIGTKFKNFPLSIFWYYPKKITSYDARMYFFFFRIRFFNFFTQTETSNVSFLIFLVIQRHFFKFESNQFKDFFFVHLLLGSRKFFSTSSAKNFFLYFFAIFFHPNQDSKRLFYIFSYFRDFFFKCFSCQSEELLFAHHLVSTRKKNHLLWLQHAFLIFCSYEQRDFKF